MSSGPVKRSEHAPRVAQARPKSAAIFDRGMRTLVGGVDSPVRAFRAVGGTPLVIERASGARLWDVDGREYIDYVCSWGALILGHAEPDVVAAIALQAAQGTSYGMTSPLGARIHQARLDREIRGLLSRPFGRVSFGGGIGPRDAGNRGVPGRA